MKLTAFLGTCILISFIKISNGQQNALIYNENCETNSPDLKQQPIFAYASTNSVQDIWNQNENSAALPNNVNQIQMQTNSLPPSPSTPQIQLPPDLQQQPLQVQQLLQLQQNPQLQQLLQLQQNPQLQQLLTPQPQMQVQPIPQSQNPLQTQPDTQPLLPLQSLIQKQSQLNPDPSYQPIQNSQTLQFQQPLILQKTLQAHDSLQPLQAIQFQQPLEFQQYSPQKQLTVPENKNLVQTPTQKINNNDLNQYIKVKWQSSNPLTTINVENPYNIQNLNFQPLRASIKPSHGIANAQKYNDKRQESSSPRYYVLSQPSVAPTVSVATAPIISNSPSVGTLPTNYLKSVEETYIPFKTPYNYVIASTPNQSTNTQLLYYNQPLESKQNTYTNQNSEFRYPEQSTVPIVLQSQAALVPTQSPILTPIPTAVPQVPSLSSQYGLTSGYPFGTIVPPAYTRPKSTNLKSVLPIIFQLLKEKIATCGCKNECPCECKNNRNDNDLKVAREVSQKVYEHFDSGSLSVLDTVSEMEQGPECLREAKNCEEIKNASLEISEEDEESDEEEVEDEESDDEES